MSKFGVQGQSALHRGSPSPCMSQGLFLLPSSLVLTARWMAKLQGRPFCDHWMQALLLLPPAQAKPGDRASHVRAPRGLPGKLLSDVSQPRVACTHVLQDGSPGRATSWGPTWLTSQHGWGMPCRGCWRRCTSPGPSGPPRFQGRPSAEGGQEGAFSSSGRGDPGVSPSVCPGRELPCEKFKA